jgi:hydrogenase-4 component F
VAEVRGLLLRRPGLAVPWLVAMVAILGFPPFSIFFSVVTISLAGWAAGMGIIVSIALFFLLIIFAALTRITVTMTLGPPDIAGPPVPDRSAHGQRLPLILALATAAVIAFLAGPVGTILIHAAAVLNGTH